jgi:poly(A) polymerase
VFSHPDYNKAVAIARRLAGTGHRALLAGGCVRDMLLNRPAKDFDIATSATPDEVEALFERTHALGKSFGVIQVLIDESPFEVATFRSDLAYIDGRRPEGIVFSSPEMDAQRRDFTINGLFYDPLADEVIDYVGGRADLSRRVIRAIGEPRKRFAEDFLRMLRAPRFASVLEFAIEPDTASAIRELAPHIAKISAERIAQELTRLLTESPRAGQGVRLLLDLGLLPVILPEIPPMIGCEQPPQFHPEGDVFVHTMMMLDDMKNPSPVLAWSVLLHDIGKPPTFAITREPDGSDRIRFNNHADVGSEMAERILRRFRMSNELIDAVVHCVANHMRFGEVSRMKESTLRKLIAAPTFETELELHRIDCMSSHREIGNIAILETFREKIRNEPILPKPWLGGRDLIATGMKPGPAMGRWLKTAYDAQLENRFPDRDTLFAWLRTEIEKGDFQ